MVFWYNIIIPAYRYIVVSISDRDLERSKSLEGLIPIDVCVDHCVGHIVLSLLLFFFLYFLNTANAYCKACSFVSRGRNGLLANSCGAKSSF